MIFFLLFGVSCWSLWKARNEAIFTDILTTPEALSRRIMSWVNTIKKALIHVQSILPTKMVREVSWMPPPPKWLSLNSKDSVLPESGQSATGGMFHDADGRCLAPYNMNLWIFSINRAKLRGVVKGLQIA
ncbi:hypothetical protein LINPERHAP2_LOCUS19812 [Linum perenne]